MKSKIMDCFSSECDAHTLMEAEIIKGDKKRMSAAAKAAVKMAEEKAAKVKMLKKVGRKK